MQDLSACIMKLYRLEGWKECCTGRKAVQTGRLYMHEGCTGWKAVLIADV
jgi:hypothetical protein